MMPWRRHRRKRPALDERAQADAWQAVSLLLDYPDERLLSLLPLLGETAAGLPEHVGGPLTTFVEHAISADPEELRAEYVDTFDYTRKCALHLTYALHGDTRRRGAALVEFRQAYRRAGVELSDTDGELPDHLCVLLEFGASADPATAWKLLNDHRVSIELLHAALLSRSSPWLPVVQALRATLPTLDGDDEQALAALIAQGPPQEDVGIDTSPYAVDPELDERMSSPTSGEGCASSPSPTRADLGPDIPVGVPR
ncbi:nitrate reductase molybdenum cofactor assembly chaperone [Janibacter corallicola]|uniref:nitrate reductase molybdenum cofactor assembly chaperone n=1 Tax=Janibacter corallicola TaxID=415212 RepID=UPI000A57A1F5|nr:nitrate reductase molybdenum cofactor assembly chaperone [Janibacter corallicola]